MFRKSVFNKRKFLVCKRKRRRESDSVIKPDDDSQFQFQEEATQNANEISSFEAEEIFPQPVEEEDIPSFFHIGFNAKSCLIKGYKIGTWHIDCGTQACENLSLYTYGQARPYIYDISGGVGLREKFGIVEATQVWQTEGLLGTCGVYTEMLGGKGYALLRGTYSHSPQADRETGKSQESNVQLEIHSGYDNSSFKTEVIIPILNATKLLGYVIGRPLENFLLGYRSVFDVGNMKFDKHVFCAGFDDGTNEFGLKLENFKNLRGSIFRNLTEKWAVAIKGNIIGVDEKRFAIGGQYQIADETYLKAKIQDDGTFGFVWQQKAKENEIEIMYHIGFNLLSPLRGDHKIGVSYSFKG